ncbi:MAG: DUF401 family protein [Chloroflexi bacterium]|nr:DUF401 family protein [Chloroflexota bacterium]MBI2979448.1 DUF401 family protein [Chloroflexota bacterium]
MLSPSLALLASIAGILILLRLRVHPGVAIFVGSLVIALLVLPLNSIPAHMLQALLDRETIRLLVIIASALTLSSLMEQKGLLSKLATTMESIGTKPALHLVPAVIGLVPMPAGALVSATASRDLVKRIGLNPEQSTFINFWFRHIWEFSLPIYPAIIITSVILSVPLFSVVKILSPISALAIAVGAVASYGILRKSSSIKGEPTKNIAYNLLKAAWPILLLVPLILAGLDAMIVFPLVLVLVAVQQMVRWPELRKALRYGLEPKILFLLYTIMLYKATIESSGAAGKLIADMQVIGLPATVMLVALPLLIGLATGISMAFAGITLPLLVPYIISGSGINTYALLLAYVSGMMGLLLSPLHLCLILSAEYFKANLAKMYRYLLPLTITMEAIVILIYYIAT